MDYALKFNINGVEKRFDVTSKDFKRGKDVCLFNPRLFTDPQMRKDGYRVVDFPSEWHSRIFESITRYVAELFRENNEGELPYNFSLEKYHWFVSEKQHKKIVSAFRGGTFGLGGIHLKHLGIPYQDLDKFINSTVGGNMSCHYKRYGLSLKHFWIRIVRPGSNDNNPPHKDAHVKWNKDSINIYLPLAGSNELSSLPLLPGSHLEHEKEYIISSSPCYVDGKKFVVPAVVHRNGGINMITPNPQQNQILIFTSHILHGGGVNLNDDITRVSLEMRFFK